MRLFAAIAIAVSAALVMAGCRGLSETKISHPYIMRMDRVDQVLEDGNRGYLKGAPPPVPDRGDLKRPMIAVDVDLPPTSGERGIPETKFVDTREETTVRTGETSQSMVKEVTITREEAETIK